ncbi:MAG: DNA mismatch repair endonuclease MutL [Thioalkalispiraceae bacterium]|jgi:DNA mismatch repair protein MutL
MSAVINNKPQIRRLPKQLANQIAAGEVVERPASIVKELLENSIDAGATRIEVVVKKGGTHSILVRDNGCGIPGEQLALAVSRHATSKITSLDDLHHLYSMGFRGEALASIGSVSRMQLTSCSEGEEQAWQFTCDNQAEDSEGQLSVASHPPGTSIHVSNLFYNAPARRKFLRSERTEYHHIEEVVRRMALSHFKIQFQLTHNQRQVFSLAAIDEPSARLRRLQRLCGKAFTDNALYLEFEHNGLKLWGWIVPPSASRPQADLQYFFVNQRIIRDRVINHAIRQAYSDKIYPGRHPAYVLHLEMSPTQVDVNVHPTKHEVRFRESRLVHDFLFHCLSEALEKEVAAIPAAETVSAIEREPFYKPATGNVPYPAPQQSVAENVEELAVSEPYQAADYQALGCLYDQYLLVEKQQQWLLLDIARALQAIYQSELENLSLPLRSLPLLFPMASQVETQQADWVEQHGDALLQWGLDISRASDKEIMVRSLPSLLQTVEPERFVRGLLEHQPRDSEEWIACLSLLAAQADQRQWTPRAMQQLLNQMAHYQLWDSPAERKPIWQSLEPAQLQRWFEAND